MIQAVVMFTAESVTRSVCQWLWISLEDSLGKTASTFHGPMVMLGNEIEAECGRGRVLLQRGRHRKREEGWHNGAGLLQ